LGLNAAENPTSPIFDFASGQLNKSCGLDEKVETSQATVTQGMIGEQRVSQSPGDSSGDVNPGNFEIVRAKTV
jgi:hypothetical protein